MKKQTFRLGSSADTAYELKKTLELQLLYISSLFSPSPEDPGEAIHEARRSYKRCRAIIRLMRDSMGYASYYRENIKLRDMQRELSRIRDTDVQYGLFRKLSESYPEFGGETWFTGIVENARKNYELEMNRFLESGKSDEIAAYTRSKALQIRKYELTGSGFEIVEGGLSRTYRQGREMGSLVFSQDTDAFVVHAFRKKAKYLQFQLYYLRSITRRQVRAMSTSMDKITENLGYYNDLHIACTTIEEFAAGNKTHQADPGLLLKDLREEMQKAKSRARKIYNTMYAEPPGDFVNRIGHYWDSHTSTQR